MRRRPQPPNFDRRVDRLVQLEKLIDESQREYDDVLVSLLVDDKAPNATIAERLGVIPQLVTYRRMMALKRRGKREAASL